MQGDSNHGKTAVLRALFWVMYNEPQGTDYVSYWAYKQLKNGIKFLDGEYTEVVVFVDGHAIVRHRDNEFNGYIVDGTKYEALHGGVPPEVTAILNLSDTSVQKQLDAPFLLSMTPGEAAQYLNKLANLEDVSGILATAKKASTDANAAAERASAEAAEAGEHEKQFGWISEVQDLADKCEKARDATNSVRDQLVAMGATVEDFDASERELHPLERALKALPPPVDHAVEIKACQEGVASLRAYRDADQQDAMMSAAFADLVMLGEYPQGTDNHRDRLEKSLDDYDKLEDISKLQAAEEQLEALGPMITAQQTPLAAMERSLKEYDGLEDPGAIGAEIEELEKSMEGQVCPTCGRPFTMH